MSLYSNGLNAVLLSKIDIFYLSLYFILFYNILFYSNLEEFGTKIISFLNDPSLKSFGKKGREYVVEKYTWEKVSKQFLNEFKILLSKK